VNPFATEGFAGVTAIDINVGAVTVSTVDPTTALRVAVILLVPIADAVARPAEEIVAMEVVAEAHVTEPVRF
jgi:hypothetical protein